MGLGTALGLGGGGCPFTPPIVGIFKSIMIHDTCICISWIVLAGTLNYHVQVYHAPVVSVQSVFTLQQDGSLTFCVLSCKMIPKTPCMSFFFSHNLFLYLLAGIKFSWEEVLLL